MENTMKNTNKTTCSVVLGDNWRKLRDLGNKTFLAGNPPAEDHRPIIDQMADMAAMMQTGKTLANTEDYGTQR